MEQNLEVLDDQVLGAGNFGVVVKGRLGDRPVAVKKVEKRLMSKVESKREETALSLLAHENVIKLYHVKDAGNSRLFVLELCEASLDCLYLDDSHAKKYRGVVPTDLNILLQFSRGLEHVHKYLIHRDIKPENIFIANEAGCVRIKVGDFGFSKPVSMNGSFQLSGLKGTPIGQLSQQHVHKHLLVHRDIKPENILIADDDGFVRVKVGDFGLSKPVSIGGSYEMSGIKGTEEWMAPELLEFLHRFQEACLMPTPEKLKELETLLYEQHASIKSDVFSAGCVFFYQYQENRLFWRKSLSQSKQKFLRPDCSGLSFLGSSLAQRLEREWYANTCIQNTNAYLLEQCQSEPTNVQVFQQFLNAKLFSGCGEKSISLRKRWTSSAGFSGRGACGGSLSCTIRSICLKHQRKNVYPWLVVTRMRLELAIWYLLSDSLDSRNKNYVLHLHNDVAPYQVGILNDSGSGDQHLELEDLRRLLSLKLTHSRIPVLPLSNPWTVTQCDARGVPYLIVLANETLNNGVCHIRSRNTSLKEEIHIADVVPRLKKVLIK
nr:EOG090X076T [Moina brachiata]